jgi:hydroxyacylglutathione hydrolase
MTMVFETVQTAGIAQLSYLIGDDSSQTAAVIDPRPEVEIYLELSRKHGVTITHIFETHIHADFMSGARELEQRVGSAKIYASAEGNATYDFQVQKICDGDRFEFGSVILTARHTPGHTPEHLSYELAEKDHSENAVISEQFPRCQETFDEQPLCEEVMVALPGRRGNRGIELVRLLERRSTPGNHDGV